MEGAPKSSGGDPERPKADAERQSTFITTRFERWALPRLAASLPRWVVPDHLIATILRAAEREISEKAAPDALPRSAQHSATRLGWMTRPWRHLFRSKAGNMLLLAAHRIVEYGDQYATPL